MNINDLVFMEEEDTFHEISGGQEAVLVAVLRARGDIDQSGPSVYGGIWSDANGKGNASASAEAETQFVERGGYTSKIAGRAWSGSTGGRLSGDIRAF